MMRPISRFRAFHLPMIITLLLLVLTCSCSSTTNVDVADAAVTKFHSLLDSELYQLICLQADKEFVGNEEGTLAYLKKVRETMGKVKQANQATAGAQNFKDEAQITLAYLTQFDEGKGMETFVFRVKDRQARLVFYECKAPGLDRD